MVPSRVCYFKTIQKAQHGCVCGGESWNNDDDDECFTATRLMMML